MSETERIANAYRALETEAASRWDQANPGNRLIVAERRRLTRRLLQDQGWLPLTKRRVLDVGSGGGAELAWFRELGAPASHLVGIDLLGDRVDRARRAYPEVEFHLGNAEHLPFPDRSFGLVVTYTVFSSILDQAMASNVAREIVRVMAPGGGLLWYDFRYDSPSNPNVRGVSAARVRALFPALHGRLHGLTLIPPLARRLGRLTPVAYPALSALPPLRSHLLGLLLAAS